MFGYIVPCVPELRVRELVQYRQYYCGVCRALKEQYGRIVDLAYDAAFVHILGDALTEEVTACSVARCAAHPFKGVGARKTASAPYAATVNILMAYSKAADDTRDGGGIRARLTRGALQRQFRRAGISNAEMTAAAQQCDEEIVALEKIQCSLPDQAAEPYGVLFGRVLMELDVVQSHILYDVGYNIGRWVYLIDAFDDMADDAGNGQYNVYNEVMRAQGISKDELRPRAAFSLQYTLSQAADALGRLDLKKNRPLLDNIVRLGLYQQTQAVLAGRERLTVQMGHKNPPFVPREENLRHM